MALEAGCDKKLIYRYFGDLDGLMRSFLREDAFLPNLQELCAPLRADEVRSLPYPSRIRHLLQNYVRGMLARPLTLAFLTWSLVERNNFTQAVDEVTSDLQRRSFSDLGLDLPSTAGDAGTMRVAAAVFGAAVNHLLIYGRAGKVPPDLNLSNDSGWNAVFDAIESMIAGLSNR